MIKRFAAIAAAVVVAGALSLGAATAASAGTDPVTCSANHPGYTGAPVSDAEYFLAIGSGAPQSVRNPNFTSPFGTSSRFDEIHPAQFDSGANAGDNGLLIQWCVGSSPRVLAEVGGKATFLPETAANVNAASDFVYNPTTQQQVDKATGDALNLGAPSFTSSGVFFTHAAATPAGTTAANRLGFAPSS